MDNAKFHHSRCVRDPISEAGIRLLYLPPYSPQLNPIENLFGVLKNRYRSTRPLARSPDIQRARLTKILISMREQPLQAYYAEMRQWVYKALCGDLFD